MNGTVMAPRTAGTKLKRKSKYHTVCHIVLIAVSLLMIFPFYWMLVTSLKVEEDLLLIPPQLFPSRMTLKNYVSVFEFSSDRISIFGAFWNTLKIALPVTLGALLSCSLAAFSFAKIPFRGSRVCFRAIIATMMVPGQITLVPMYMIFAKVGWVDSVLPLIVPSIMINAYGTFLMYSFILGIPDSYLDVAKTEGAPLLLIYVKIVLPLCTPVLITQGLFLFLGAWNDFMGALIYLDTESKFTLSLFLNMYRSQYNINWGNIMAASTLAILPVMVLYLFTQRFLIEGIAISGLK